MPDEPILRAFHNIKVENAVLQADPVFARDAKGLPKTRRDADGAAVEVYTYKNPRRADWPPADFIVGNPPFIGGKDLRARLGEEQAQALWRAHADMNELADFVMYWWNQAAEILTASGSVLRRFGFVTTNSITQVFQRRVTERYLTRQIVAVAGHGDPRSSLDEGDARCRRGADRDDSC